jgi:hypothetical protein
MRGEAINREHTASPAMLPFEQKVVTIGFTGAIPMRVRNACPLLPPQQRTSTHLEPMSALCRYCCKSLSEVAKEKFLEPLMRFTRGDVMDRIVSYKIDHGPP